MAPIDILITGGNGHIGFHTLRQALEKGYTVRAAVRTAEKGESILNNPALSHIHNLNSKLKFVVGKVVMLDKGWGDEVNVEFDLVGKLVEKSVGAYFEGKVGDDAAQAVLAERLQKGS